MGVSDERIGRLRAACAEAGLDAMLVRDTSSICWATAFDGVFDEERAHVLYVDGSRAVLHTDSRYELACRTAAEGTCVRVDATRCQHARFAADLVRDAAACGTCEAESASASAGLTSAELASAELASAEPTPSGSARLALAGSAPAFVLGIEDSITLAEFRQLEAAFAVSGAGAGSEAGTTVVATAPAPATATASATAPAPAPTPASVSAAALTPAPTLRETSGLVLGLRAVKDADEVRRMRVAQAITDAAFAHITRFMRPCMTEREVQLELEGYMLSHGASGLAFSSIVAAGANGASPHAIPGDTRLEAGQCVVMDFGARALGYCSDMTRMVFLGQPEGRMCAAWETLRRANEEVEALLRPGVTGRQAHELAERILDEGGFGGCMGHGLGHGVGIDVHEEPVLAPRNERALVSGNVVTVEPGIYIAGCFGMRLEDFGVITEDGFEVFTQSTHDLVVI